jgi:integrase
VTPPKSEDPRLSAFRDWLTRRRGLSAETLRRYVQEAGRWLDTLGDGMSGCEAGRVRAVVLDQAPERSRSSIRMTTTVLRAYLRFRVAAGEVRPALVDAVPTAPRRRLATIPRYVPPAVIERIVASTAGADAAAVRDRAIILLLARLGLRAGDLWRLTLGDLDWERGEMLLHGKGGLRARMPLPQDAGDALLAYIETTRPRSLKARIFLRLQPPHRPFASSAEIAGIVARVLKRGGFSGVPSGSHMFRHSLATSMLRGGASLDSVGVVLRHRHPSTTAIYAKADVAMLTRIAQPWPGDASC